jgi:hypothetical protein
MDSFQNILFSLLLFNDKTGHAPTHLTIVSHAFKRERFLRQYLATLRWPADLATYIGIDPPTIHDKVGRELIEKGEKKAREWWNEDPWGWGEVLGEQRRKRGWKDEDWSDMSEKWKELVIWRGDGEQRGKMPEGFPWIME